MAMKVRVAQTGLGGNEEIFRIVEEGRIVKLGHNPLKPQQEFMRALKPLQEYMFAYYDPSCSKIPADSSPLNRYVWQYQGLQNSEVVYPNVTRYSSTQGMNPFFTTKNDPSLVGIYAESADVFYIVKRRSPDENNIVLQEGDEISVQGNMSLYRVEGESGDFGEQLELERNAINTRAKALVNKTRDLSGILLSICEPVDARSLGGFLGGCHSVVQILKNATCYLGLYERLLTKYSGDKYTQIHGSDICERLKAIVQDVRLFNRVIESWGKGALVTDEIPKNMDRLTITIKRPGMRLPSVAGDRKERKL